MLRASPGDDYPEAGTYRVSGDASDMSGGWDLLRAGNYSAALSQFAFLAESNPREGAPKAGFALSVAAQGNLDRGVWAMRRAFRYDPEGVEYLVADAGLNDVVNSLANAYQTDYDTTNKDADTAFMLGALHYLAGRNDSASEFVAAAQNAGDRSPSTKNLDLLLKSSE